MIKLNTFRDLNVGDYITYITVNEKKDKRIVEIDKSFSKDYVTIKTENEENGDILLFPAHLLCFHNKEYMVYPTNNAEITNIISTSINMTQKYIAEQFNKLFGNNFSMKRDTIFNLY